MRYMLDTDCCVELLRGRAAHALERIAAIGLDRVHLSSITVGELLVGAARSADPARNTLRVVRFCAGLRIAAFDDRAAASYATARAALEALEARGTPIGPIDTLIAGHAIAIGATLVTGNPREFGRVEGLAIANWIARSS
jgi:tRNA(fMet)-specific endonuclease VapC